MASRLSLVTHLPFSAEKDSSLSGFAMWMGFEKVRVSRIDGRIFVKSEL